MADKTVITKAGLKIGKWNSEKKEMEYHITAHPFRYLRDHIEIELDVTLKDIFNIVEADPQLTEFVACYSYCGWIKEFHEAAKEPPNIRETSDVVALEISHVFEVHEYKGEGAASIEVWQDFVGIGKEGAEHSHYSMSCTPMNEMVHLPLRLNTKVECRKNWSDKLFEGEMGFSLLEVLDAIYYDISFHGGPQDNKAFVEELKQQIDDIEAGRVELIPAEDVFARLGLDDEDEVKEPAD